MFGLKFSALRKSKIKAFFFFLLLAMLFWILTKFSKEYTATVHASLSYFNVPNNAMLTKDNPKDLSFDLTSNGFGFLFYKIKDPTVRIDVLKYYNDGDKQVTIVKSELVKLTSTQLKQNIAVKNIAPESLVIGLDGIVTKKLPVKTNINISFRNGFQALDSVRAVPDSVVVSGPSKDLAKLTELSTKLIVLKDVETNISEEVSIVLPDSLQITTKPKKVIVKLSVDEFAQKEFILPIEVINLPEGTTIKLIPKVVTLSFSVALNNFKTIDRSDFRLVCDFGERNATENFMIPKLVKSPKSIMNAEFDTKKIDYLIFK